MQFEISKSSLVKALSSVNGAVEKKNTIPILLNVRIEAKDGKLSFTATDMDIVVVSLAAALIKKEGVTTIPAQLFYDIVRKIPDGANISVELQKAGNSIKIKYDKSKFSLPCIDPADFPVLSEGDMSIHFAVKSSDLMKVIDKTRFAISNDETRYYLNGMFFHITQLGSNAEFRGVATDGHRLALSSFMINDLKTSVPSIIIPKKAIHEIRRIIEGSEKVEIFLSKTKIKVACGDSIIISKLIDGEFPEYDKVVPKNNHQIIKVNKKVIFDAIDRVSTIANDKHRSIKFILEDNKILLQVNTTDGGFADEEIDVDFKGERIEAGFNSRYLLEIINQINGEQINFKFKDGISPALLDCDDGDSLYVIMPVRI